MISKIKKLYNSYILKKAQKNEIIFMRRFNNMDPKKLIEFIEYSSKNAIKYLENNELSPEDITDEICDIYRHLESLSNAIIRLSKSHNDIYKSLNKLAETSKSYSDILLKYNTEQHEDEINNLKNFINNLCNIFKKGGQDWVLLFHLSS